MKETQQLEESLRTLPKFSLDEEDKQKILTKLRNQQTCNRRTLKPIISLAAIFSIIFVFVLTEFQPHPREVEFTSNAAGMFYDLEKEQNFIGIEGRVGILNVFNHFVAEDHRRSAKLMIYFWGEPKNLAWKNYKIEAMNRKEETIILSEGTLYNDVTSAAQVLTRFAPFPTEGEWELSFYVEGTLFEQFTLDILPPFPKTEHYIFRNSPLELSIGNESEVNIESVKDKKEITVKLLDKNDKMIEENVFQQTSEGIDAITGKPLYLYTGKLTFPEKAKWSFIIDEEKTEKFNN